MKRFLFGGSNKGEHRKEPKTATDDSKGKDDIFLMLDGCLMIFGGSVRSSKTGMLQEES